MIAFDTNVLVYATSQAPSEKSRRARELVANGLRSSNTLLLMQTLGEFSSVALRKEGMPVGAVSDLVDAWQRLLPCRAAEPADLLPALNAVRDHRLSFWDALLWATAWRVGVRYLLTEDLQDGRILEGVRFVNPFEPANDTLLSRILPNAQSHPSSTST